MTKSLKFDDSQYVEFENDLKSFAEKAVPFAHKSMLNTTAFYAQGVMRDEIGKKMINRNAWTKRSVQVNMAKTLNMRNQMSTVGSVAEYMEDREFGGTSESPIPTSFASGEEGARPRKKQVVSRNRLAAIVLKRRAVKAKSRKQRNIILIKQAAKSGDPYVYLNFGRTKGIFRVLDSDSDTEIKMVHDMTKPVILVKPIPTLGPAMDAAEKKMPEFYVDALKFQIERNKLFR